ncbi:unnamed protein product [Mytilus coruscus]|uniref:Novel STAND NTPase 3 domain-containing protein n=1 Tax=Mytilus coruscus TaxID=42192 RepID=A0A6J8BKY9_MYTCO|nr:unnamed protein product [Mytilus coruscus]
MLPFTRDNDSLSQLDAEDLYGVCASNKRTSSEYLNEVIGIVQMIQKISIGSSGRTSIGGNHINDIFGKVNVDYKKLREWEILFSDIHTCINDESCSVYVVITIRDNILRQMKRLLTRHDPFRNIDKCLVNISMEDEVDREMILRGYIPEGFILYRTLSSGLTTLNQTRDKRFVISPRYYHVLVDIYLVEIEKGSLKDVVGSEAMETDSFVNIFVLQLKTTLYFKTWLVKEKCVDIILYLAVIHYPPWYKLMRDIMKHASQEEKGLIFKHKVYPKWFKNDVFNVLRFALERSDIDSCLML